MIDHLFNLDNSVHEALINHKNMESILHFMLPDLVCIESSWDDFIINNMYELAYDEELSIEEAIEVLNEKYTVSDFEIDDMVLIFDK